MTLTLELSDELEKELEAAAAQRGISAEQLALQALENLVHRPMKPKALKAYGMLAGRGHNLEDSLKNLHELDEAQEEKFERLRQMGVQKG